ncbi:MAG: cytochrome P450 [Hyphomicrobiaceae bacterium]|jgi:cytochrome P450
MSADTPSQLDWAGCDPLSAEFRDDPYPFLHHLRETDPVNLTPLGTWRVSRFDDIDELLRNGPVSQTNAEGINPMFDPKDRSPGSFVDFMLNKDDEVHARLRRLVFKAFTRRAVAAMEAQVEQTVDAAITKGLAEGGLDVIQDLALPVPATMICKVLGVPDSDLDQFTEWTQARTNAFFAAMLPPEVCEKARQAGESLAAYFDDLIAERRKNLGDDLLSELIRVEEDGEKLSAGEIVPQVVGLLVAGFETTIGLIGNGTRALIDHPAEKAKLLKNPALIDDAVEECLRYDSPILMIWRVLTQPFTLGGTTIPEGAVVWPMLASGNRDPLVNPDPDRFDITRKNIQYHSFGGGSHFCLGHQLAKMEARIAIGELIRRAPSLRVETEGVEWSDSFFRVYGKLPVRIG